MWEYIYVRMADEITRSLTPNRRTVLRSIGAAGFATTLQTGTVIGASGDESSSTYGFETGLDEWTVVEDSFSRTNRVAYEGSYAAGLDSSGSIDTVAYVDLSETIRPEGLNFAWRETSGSFGGGILLRNENDDMECFAGSNNPQWIVIGDNSPDGPGSTYVPGDVSKYDRWIQTELEFDWSDNSFTVTFTDAETGSTATDTFSLNKGVNIDQIELHGYAGAEYEAGSEPETGSCDMYWDEIEIVTGEAGGRVDEYTKLKKSLIIHHKMNRYRDDGKIPDATGNGVVGHPEDEYIDDGFLEFVDDESRGTALEFNGDGTDSLGGSYNIHHEDLPDSLEEGDPITLSVWAKPRNLDEWNSITNNSLGVGIDIRRGEIRARRWEGEHVFMAAADVDSYLTTGEWHHLLATVAPGDEVRLFIDGELAATDSADPDHGFRTAYKTQGVGWLGSDADGIYDARFDGLLDDLRFYVGESASGTVAEQLFEDTKGGTSRSDGDDSGSSTGRYTDSEGYVDSEGLLDAGADYRNGEISEDRLGEVASAFRSGEPLA